MYIVLYLVAVTFAILATGSISGAHLNSAVTLTLATYRGFAWFKVPFYIVAQVLGCATGSAAMYSVYSTVFDQYFARTGTTFATSVAASEAFFTQPQPYESNWLEMTQLFWQTGILLFGIFAVTDPYNPGAYMHSGLRALIIGFLVAMIGMAYGFLEGWSINPARDFGPRFVGWALGMDGVAFPGVNNSWWAPIVGCFIGGILGGGIYEMFIRPWMPGVRVHGDTPTTGAWAWLVLKMFPSLLDTTEFDDDNDKYHIDEKGRKRRGRKSDVWDMEQGPGGNVPALTGIRGYDDDLPNKYIYNSKYSSINTPSAANSNMGRGRSVDALGTDLDIGNYNYQPTSVLTTAQNTPTNTNGYSNDITPTSQPGATREGITRQDATSQV